MPGAECSAAASTFTLFPRCRAHGDRRIGNPQLCWEPNRDRYAFKAGMSIRNYTDIAPLKVCSPT